MRELDTATFLMTQDNPAGPIIQFVENGIEPQGPMTDADGNVSKASAAAYLVAYAILAGFVGYLIFAL
ncbi:MULTISPECIES: hypothetical protein [Sphingobium]|jgi:hypothetical protein|uniref:Uncharacterized protein n=2 Tax=Sphingobium TaxID=165695 RepID=A0A081RHT9_SPHCR|nr:hypothetical protein [Sphingobium chlorophenolicum]KEQ54762.1 hypothetical protein BV95_00991 [Sphingobium chlorophenolicum]